MKYVKWLIVLVLFFPFYNYSQNEARNWYFGNNAGLSFATNPPTVLSNGALSTSVGCSSISDPSGNLLFYTDGMTIWNQAHSVMANGTGIFGTHGAQNCIITKKPLSTTQYYLFTVAGGGSTVGLCYSVIDMSLASGNGSVTSKNIPLYSGSLEEKIAATRHCNQSDIWVMTRQMDTCLFSAYLLTSTGVNTTAVISSSGPNHSGPSYKGSIKFSPNGKKLAELYTISSYSSPAVGYLSYQYHSFNNSTGAVSNYTAIGASIGPNNAWSYGCEFSPDGSKLYFTYHGYIIQHSSCQVPVTTNGFLGSEENIPIAYNRGSMQLAPNGKIYISKAGSTHLDVINNPNAFGSACNYVPLGLSLGTLTTQLGLPTFLSNYFEKTTSPLTYTYGPNCLNVLFGPPALCAFTGYSVGTTFWKFGDPASGNSNSSNLNSPNHLYSAPGTYTAQLIITYLCGKTDTLYQPVTVNSPTMSLNTFTTLCSKASATVTGSGAGPYSFSWTPGALTNSVVNNLSTNVYTIQMLDITNNCSISINAPINTSFLTGTLVNSHVLCYGANSGSINTLILGGSGTFNYNWNPANINSGSLTNLSPGTYSVAITDAQTQCTLNLSTQIIQPPPLTMTLSASNLSACAGSPIILTSLVTGGTPGYSFKLNTNSSPGVVAVTQTLAGIYNYTSTGVDNNNCSVSKTLSLNYIPQPTLITSGQTICLFQSGILSVTGASAYTWSPVSSNGPSITVNPSGTTTYWVTGSHLGCSSTATATIIVNPLPSIVLSSNNPVCTGQSINLSASGGSSYQWSGPGGFSSPLPNPVIVSSGLINSGLYTVTVTSTFSCSASNNIVINVLPLPLINVVGNLSICIGQSTSLIASGASNYTWSVGGNGSVISINPNINTTYSVTGSSSNGCLATKSVYVTVSECIGLVELKNVNFKIYPNPNNGFFNIECVNKCILTIYDAAGVIIYKSNLNAGKNEVDLSTQPKGVFILKFTGLPDHYTKLVITE